MSKVRFIDIVNELNKAITDGFLHRDPNNENNVLIYREAGVGTPEGWYSENILDLASELTHDGTSYTKFKEALAVAKSCSE